MNSEGRSEMLRGIPTTRGGVLAQDKPVARQSLPSVSQRQFPGSAKRLERYRLWRHAIHQDASLTRRGSPSALLNVAFAPPALRRSMMLASKQSCSASIWRASYPRFSIFCFIASIETVSVRLRPCWSRGIRRSRQVTYASSFSLFVKSLKHCTEVQLEAAESTPCPSKFVSDLPG
jgi:hypothetical protein